MEFKTTNGTVIEFKEITGRDNKKAKQSVASKSQLGSDGKVSGLSLEDANEFEDRRVELAVISVNGKTENVLDLVLDLPLKDSDEVYKQVSLLFGDPEKKTK